VLDFLRIRGLALLDDVALEFEPGMNVLTGETGAGKSIIVDALTLLRGGRGRAELVREGSEAARVEAQFTVRGRVGARLRPLFEEHGLELEDEALVVERRVKRSGRGRIALQSNLSTLAVLAEVGGELLEICSQHEHHSLTHVGHHLELLDAYAELDAELADYAEGYRVWRELADRIRDIRAREAERLQRADYLRFQIDELERVAPQVGEYDEARGRLALLREAGKLHEFASATHQMLYESDDALAARLGMLLDRARRLPHGSRALDEVVEQLEAARTERTKVLVFVSPSNPTGAVYSPAEVQAIGEWALAHGLWVVTDEIYEHLVYGDAEFSSMPVLVPGLADRCVVVNGVAKTYAMTGWRVGWMIGPADIVKAATNLQSHATSNVANVSQVAALAAVSGDLSAVAEMRTAFDRRRVLMAGMLDAIPGVACPLPEGAFYVYPSVRDLVGRSLGGVPIESSAHLAGLILDEAEVAVVPGEAFGTPGYLRLSYALGDDDLHEGATRIANLLGEAQ